MNFTSLVILAVVTALLAFALPQSTKELAGHFARIVRNRTVYALTNELGALDFTSAAALLKEYYTHEKIETEVFDKSPWLAMVPKNPDASGVDYVVPLVYGNPAGRSAVLAKAITNAVASKAAKFTVTWAQDYGYATIDNKTIKAMRNDEGAFVRAMKLEVDGMLHRMKRSLQTSLFRNGSGSIGVVGSIATVNLTLATQSDAANFEVNDVLVASSTDSNAGLRNAGATATVTAINRTTGVLTSGANWTVSIAALAAGDFLFIEGDNSQGKFMGLGGWIPSSTPTSTAFFGLDRTTDTERLGGIRYTATGLSLEESLLELCGRVNDNGGSVSHVFVNPKQYRALIKQLGSKVAYMVGEGGMKARISFKGVVIDTDSGPVPVFPDINCPNNLAYAVTMDTWELASLGPAPALFDTDDQTLLRVANSDSVEVRGVAYGNLVCNAPGWNGVATLDAVA